MLSLSDGLVRFRWTEYADGDRVKVMELEAAGRQLTGMHFRFIEADTVCYRVRVDFKATRPLGCR
jgi:hypothetical protein